ncbi:hypothetical protein RRF57_010758 [Xylaria bambusicola]|uniref:Uncharacterized protein n=1 Tax=Xylaria bambusicola TaxID=326684 RepID=A0AAN7ZCR8_9PEZI
MSVFGVVTEAVLSGAIMFAVTLEPRAPTGEGGVFSLVGWEVEIFDMGPGVTVLVGNNDDKDAVSVDRGLDTDSSVRKDAPDELDRTAIGRSGELCGGGVCVGEYGLNDSLVEGVAVANAGGEIAGMVIGIVGEGKDKDGSENRSGPIDEAVDVAGIVVVPLANVVQDKVDPAILSSISSI